MYRRSRFRHTLSSRPWAGRQNLVYGFSAALARRQAGIFIPLSPSLGLSYTDFHLFHALLYMFQLSISIRAETALLNKFVEISTTAGRFCSRCHLLSLHRPGAAAGRSRTHHEGPGGMQSGIRTRRTLLLEQGCVPVSSSAHRKGFFPAGGVLGRGEEQGMLFCWMLRLIAPPTNS